MTGHRPLNRDFHRPPHVALGQGEGPHLRSTAICNRSATDSRRGNEQAIYGMELTDRLQDQLRLGASGVTFPLILRKEPVVDVQKNSHCEP
jgi:hypothetical protein